MALSPVSLQHLATCHPDLVALFTAVAEQIPILIICGMRDQEAQNAAVAAGRSRTPWPTSRHNSCPSEAVDAAILPLNWDRIDDFRQLNDVVQKQAAILGLRIEWGGDFVHLKDFDHFQLAR